MLHFAVKWRDWHKPAVEYFEEKTGQHKSFLATYLWSSMAILCGARAIILASPMLFFLTGFILIGFVMPAHFNNRLGIKKHHSNSYYESSWHSFIIMMNLSMLMLCVMGSIGAVVGESVDWKKLITEVLDFFYFYSWTAANFVDWMDTDGPPKKKVKKGVTDAVKKILERLKPAPKPVPSPIGIRR